ncbi:DnaJ domain containing protein [Tritrichomonas foetus]|uniref:DnaJ domain containing protein n=1 Tax=Tritrichomonas foetus TaxID=1144522 RepID=A0A1J4KLM3_9EUKA|nr:DnaJ domain containing protein [Tritrichomonas foetus]|eukprot:OHT10277.1 DnaJ domain containing protein [Tritrichomonas foetus]
MLGIFLVTAFSIDTPLSIRKQINGKQYEEAYKASNSLIVKGGNLDASPELFFLRGIASLRLQKFDQSITDLSFYIRSINEPNNSNNEKDRLKAYSMRGLAYLKKGNFEDAQNDADSSKDLELAKLIKKAQLLFTAAQSNETSPNVAVDKYLQLTKICCGSSDIFGQAASVALQLGNNTLFADLSAKGLRISPNDARILELNGRYYFNRAEFPRVQYFASKCINVASNPGKCTALLRASNRYQSNEKSAKEAIKKKDFTAAQNHFNTCQEIVKQYANDDSPLSIHAKRIQLDILLSKNKKEEALSILNDLIEASPNNDDLLIQRGEILMELEDYTGALQDFQIVRKKNKNNKKVLNLIEKVSKLQDKEKNVDLYTVLGLKHGASIREVKDAYRKAAIKWHPDRFKNQIEKKKAEKKMKQINAAYDVLGDEQKKKMYDLGQDPDHPTSQPNDSNMYSNRYPNSNQGFNSRQGRQSGNVNMNINLNDILKMFGGGGGGAGIPFANMFTNGMNQFASSFTSSGGQNERKTNQRRRR